MNKLITNLADTSAETQKVFLDVTLEIQIRPARLSKSIMDYGFTTLILIPMAPFLALVAVMIKLDSPGPVFFRQSRFGLNDKIFKIWKFRTMYEKDADPDGNRLTTKNDDRVTRLGKWLRKFSIDELPQLFNVLSGDMSLVGPRPHPVKAKVGDRFYSEVCSDYAQRHVIKPGLTGWAQVNGWRGETTTDHQIQMRVKHDLEYIRRQSLKFDLEILWLTVRRELISKTAF